MTRVNYIRRIIEISKNYNVRNFFTYDKVIPDVIIESLQEDKKHTFLEKCCDFTVNHLETYILTILTAIILDFILSSKLKK